MSIPKEPRQLMINLMYLVLTAMLALNVSAEIILAFFALDRSNQHTTSIISKELTEKFQAAQAVLDDPSKLKYKEGINPAIDKIRALSKDFQSYVEELRGKLIDAGGNKDGKLDDGDYYEDHGHKFPLGKKDKDITTRILGNTADGGEGKGKELENKIIETRKAMLDVYNQLLDQYGVQPFGLKPEEVASKKKSMEGGMTLEVEEVHGDDGSTDWATVKFRQMPLAAVLPMLSGIQNNATTSEASLVNEILSYVGGRVVKFDQFFPVISAKKAYLIKGETFEAEVSIGSYSSSLDPKNVRLSVGGSSISLDKTGKGKYTASASEVGRKTLKLTCSVTNPLTGEVVNGESQYEYEVGVRSVTVSADQMNVFYIGVDNPVTVAAAGVSSNDLKVSCSGGGCNLKPNGSGKYIVTVSDPGAAKITVSGGGLTATNFDFRVKRIPNPLACFKMGEGDYKTDGIIKSGVMGAQRGIFAELVGFDFNAKCSIESYTLYYTRARQDPVEVKASGASFSGNALNAVQAAKPGDQYQFVDIKAKCPGDKFARQVNGMAFQVK